MGKRMWLQSALAAVILGWGLLPLGGQAVASAAPPASQVWLTPAAPGNYLVGAGDLLYLAIYNRPELSGYVRVNARGTVRVAFGKTDVPVLDRTTAEIDILVGASLVADDLVRHPRVEATVIEVHSKAVTVMGAVNKPTTIQAVRPLRLLEALGDAGGLLPGAGNHILITRHSASGDTTQDLTVNEVISDPTIDPILQGGEEIRVLPGGSIFVVGAVNQPGGFPLGNGDRMTALKALALGKGSTASGNTSRAVLIRESATGAPVQIPVDLPMISRREKPDVAMQTNDILYIPDNNFKRTGLQVLSSATQALTYAGGLLLGR